ncbi:ABC transporter permease [Frigoribacterium sp. PvP032]|uniref:ABC transporter permease n=1 Tax=Frigoribacterium sp. PvP032 TaxID=2806589 RepID=UPI001AE28DD0|nr:ABC transporter permease [Frigoribacterium sp. PvP032]MBP1190088.1 ABC-2 type transport system permease protein [Frigoribacterium sp. PvP032]
MSRVLALAGVQVRHEVRTYFRAGDTVFFTFLFPVVMLAIFSTAFSASGSYGVRPDGSAVDAAAYYLPGMIAAGVLLSGVQALGIDIAVERSDGTLKRLAGTPLPVASWFLGKLGQVVVTNLLQVALLLVVARVLFRVPLPTEASSWATFGWVWLLGLAGSALIGIALSRVPRTGRSATAVIVPITLVLQFISGVYLPFTQLPTWLQQVASAFPLKWLAQGMRSVFLPESSAAAEVGGTWDLAGVALWLAVWLVAGAVAARLTFRWGRKDA